VKLGKKHDVYQNPRTGVTECIPRHHNINEILAKGIIKEAFFLIAVLLTGLQVSGGTTCGAGLGRSYLGVQGAPSAAFGLKQVYEPSNCEIALSVRRYTSWYDPIYGAKVN
jgi:hypothetical protein